MKKQVLKLDIDDYGDDSQNLAYIFFHTTVPGYAFVDDLNHLYRLTLRRLDDLSIEGQPWPLYTYHDLLQKLDYYLIERPSGATNNISHWSQGHKMMIIKGELAMEAATRISDEFVTPLPPPDKCNPMEAERFDILASYQQAFTPVTLYDMNPPTTASKKTLKERVELEKIFTTILDLLDLSAIE